MATEQTIPAEEPQAVVAEDPNDVTLPGADQVDESENVPVIAAEAPPTEAAPAVEAPPEPQPTVDAPPPVPAADSRFEVMQRQNAEAQRRLAEYEARDVQAEINKVADQRAAQYIQQLESQGIDTAAATTMAQPIRDSAAREAQITQQARELDSFYASKARAVTHYSKQYGVPPDQLWKHNDQDAMEEAAKGFSQSNTQLRAANQRIAALEATVAGISKARAPVQDFDNSYPTPAAVSSYENDLQRYNEGSRDAAAQAAAKRAVGEV